MSKSALIIDMPESCDKCRFCRKYIENKKLSACCEAVNDPNDEILYREINTNNKSFSKKRQKWCPLKTIPDEHVHDFIASNGYCDGFDTGWNAFWEELLGE